MIIKVELGFWQFVTGLYQLKLKWIKGNEFHCTIFNTYGCMVEKGHGILLYCIFTAIVIVRLIQVIVRSKGLRE